MEPARLGLTNYRGTAAWDDRVALREPAECCRVRHGEQAGGRLGSCGICAPPSAAGSRAGLSAGPVGTCSATSRVIISPNVSQETGHGDEGRLQPCPWPTSCANLTLHSNAQKEGAASADGLSPGSKCGAEDTQLPASPLSFSQAHALHWPETVALPGACPADPTLSPKCPSLEASNLLPTPFLSFPSLLDKGQVSPSNSIPATWSGPSGPNATRA